MRGRKLITIYAKITHAEEDYWKPMEVKVVIINEFLCVYPMETESVNNAE